MRRPRHPGRWIAAGAAVAAFAAVVISMPGASAASVAKKPVPTPTKHHLTPAVPGKESPALAPAVVPDQYTVRLKDQTADEAAVRAQATRLATRYGGSVHNVYSRVTHGYAAQMTATQAAKLAASGEVASVTPVHVVHVADTEKPDSWGLDRIDQQTLPLDQSYTVSSGTTPVTAYILDTGVNTDHAQFGGRASFGHDSLDTTPVTGDCYGHGTHVAGTVGGNTVGVDNKVKIVSVKIADCKGDATDTAIQDAFDWVAKNASGPSVINYSFEDPNGIDTVADDAIRGAIASGITVVASAGNHAVDACTRSPGDVTNAIVVGATEEGDERALFSNTGSCVSLFAPGVDITSAYYGDNSSLAVASGTSMAAPHVTGAAALILSANPTFTPAQVKDAILSRAITGAVHNAGTGSPNLLLDIASSGTGSNAAPIVFLAHANNQYVTADASGNPLVTNRMQAGPWEQFDLIDAGGGFVALQARSSGRYVSADLNRSGTLVADRTSIGIWEKFKVVLNGAATHSLIANANDMFVSADQAGTGSLIANRSGVGAWEQFDVYTPPAVLGIYSFALDSNGSPINPVAVSADKAGQSPLIANRGSIGQWEQFEEIDAGNGFIALRSHANGMFVTADLNNGGTLIANRTTVGTWEKFAIVANDDPFVTMSLFANANGDYVSNGNLGQGPLVANVTNRDPAVVGSWSFVRTDWQE